jgi:zinc transport system substrate-binding protein
MGKTNIKTTLKIVRAIVCAVFCFTSSAICAIPFSGCAAKTGDKITIVCTIFPQYDWVRQIVGASANRFDISYLANDGGSLHEYAPSVKAVAKITNADLFIYVGGESDEWVENLNPRGRAISLMDTLDEYDALAVEEGGIENGGDEDDEYDEHVYLSLKNAKIFVAVIANAIMDIDRENEDIYFDNGTEYIDQLGALDREYTDLFSFYGKTFVFADRFPFTYLKRDYFFYSIAAFRGCSSNTLWSPSTLLALKNFINDNEIAVILTLDNPNNDIKRLVNSLKEDCNGTLKVLQLHYMESVNQKNAKGATYLGYMQENLSVFAEAYS